jgi:hypothetical protein
MNGRGAISWFGWMIILSVISNDKRDIDFKEIIFLLFALLCCSVSSGTFTVAFFVVVAYLSYLIFIKMKLKHIAYAVILLYTYTDLAMEGINRNISYYSLGTGNPIVNMLEHGFGSFVRQYSISISIIIALLFVIITVLLFSMKRKITYWEYTIILFPIFGGVFGYTTLTLLLPSVVLIVSRRIGASEGRKRTAM